MLNQSIANSISREIACLPPFVSLQHETVQIYISRHFSLQPLQMQPCNAYFLVIPLNTSVNLFFDSMPVCCQNGHALLLPPGQSCLTMPEPALVQQLPGQRVVTLQIETETLREITRTFMLPDLDCSLMRWPILETSHVVLLELQRLLQQYNKQGAGYQDHENLYRQAGKIALEMLYCKACQAQALSAVCEFNRCKGNETPKKLIDVYRYMVQNLHENLMVRQLARQFNASDSQLIRLFNQYYGKSPYQTLIHIRLQHAAYLLANTSWLIQDICTECGFSSAGRFAGLFCRENGMTPKTYRKTVCLQRRAD